MDFTSLGVPAPLAAALAARGITEPTEIQREVIPGACAGESLIGEAPTGTGKTLAYLLPALMRIDPAVRAAQVLVLAPTHELAMQIAGVARELVQAAGLSVGVQALIGGANVQRQVDALKKKPALIVGSAPRIVELHRLRKLKLQEVRLCVLDEFDRLLGKCSCSRRRRPQGLCRRRRGSARRASFVQRHRKRRVKTTIILCHFVIK